MLTDFFIVTGILLAGLIGFEIVARMLPVPKQVMRKIIHIGMCVLVAVFTLFFEYHVMIFTGLFFTVLLIVARKIFPFYSLRDRRKESWGEILFPLGIAAAAVVATNQQAFVAAMLILAFSDTAAYVVGKRFTKSKQILPGRTIAGSGAGLLVSVVILLCMQYPVLISLATAFVVAAAEILSKRGFDNITMPLAAVSTLAVLSVL